MRLTRYFAGLIVLGLLFCTFGCSPEGDGSGEGGASPSGGGSDITIAVIPKGTSHEFWKSIHAGAVKASKELGVKIIWKGPQKEDDRMEQIKVVESFIARNVDGMVLAPLDKEFMVRPVEQAVDAGIPVVIIDSGLDSKKQISFVATDNEKGGVKAAERMGELLDGKGRVIVLRYQVGSASTMAREKGFLDTLAKSFPGIKIVSSKQYGGATRESAMKKSESLLLQHKSDLDGIFCPNESTTYGMLRALQQFDLAGKIFFVGFDTSETLVKAMKEKQIHGLVLQNPFMMGEEGVRTMVRHLRDRSAKVEKRIDTGVAMATPDNMDDSEIKELLHPDFEKWLK